MLHTDALSQMFIFYIAQAAVLTILAIGVAVAALTRNPKHQHARAQKTVGSVIFTAITERLDGISVAAGTFALVLPGAIFVQVLATFPRILSYKELLIEWSVIVLYTTFSVWLWRIGACLRRLQAESTSCPLCGAKKTLKYSSGGSTARRPFKQILPVAVLILMSITGIVALGIFDIVVWVRQRDSYQPFHFEDFWDDVCGFDYIVPRWRLIGCGALLVTYCVLRIVLKFIIKPSSKDRSDEFRRRSLMDILFLGLFSIGSLVSYVLLRNSLVDMAGINRIGSGWALGQVLAVSSLLSLVVTFCLGLCRLSPLWHASNVLLTVCKPKDKACRTDSKVEYRKVTQEEDIPLQPMAPSHHWASPASSVNMAHRASVHGSFQPYASGEHYYVQIPPQGPPYGEYQRYANNGRNSR